MYKFEPSPELGNKVRRIIETSNIPLTIDLNSAVSIGSSLLWELKHLEPSISDSAKLSAITAWHQAIKKLAELNEKDSAEYVKLEYAKIHKPNSYKEALVYINELSHFKALNSIFEQILISIKKPNARSDHINVRRLCMTQIGAFYFHITGLKPIDGEQSTRFSSLGLPLWHLVFPEIKEQHSYEQSLEDYIAEGCPEYANVEFLIEIAERQGAESN